MACHKCRENRTRTQGPRPARVGRRKPSRREAGREAQREARRQALATKQLDKFPIEISTCE
jgi:hypothetical protein